MNPPTPKVVDASVKMVISAASLGCNNHGFCSKFHDQLTLSGYGDIRPQKVNMQIYNAGQRNAKKRKLNDSSQRVVSGECRFGANCNRKANCRFTHPQAQAKPVPMKVDENAD
eukprot:856644_1